jgi:bisphosphoglycerate-independent phosphoglycerate mutase (AlkP superfamily)
VPFILCGAKGAIADGGGLADVAPTLLGVQGFDAPAEMTGRDLRKPA